MLAANGWAVWLCVPTYCLSIYHKTLNGTLTIPHVSVSFLSVGGTKLKQNDKFRQIRSKSRT